MRSVYFIILFIFSCSIALSQVHIKSHSGESVYGIVCEETVDNITVLKPDGFRHVIPIKQMYYLKELDALIKTKDSMSFTAHIFFIDNDSLYFHFGGGKTPRSIPRINVLDFEYDSGNLQINNKVNEIKPETDTDGTTKTGNQIPGGYWMYGITLLCPGGVNLLIGGQFENGYGLRFQGGLFGMSDMLSTGVQLNFLFNLKKTVDFEQNISVGIGSIMYNEFLVGDRKTKGIHYVGMFYDVNISGFFLETGLAFNRGRVSDSYVFLQFGYVIR
jgi:hypothetical protein